MGLDLPVVGPGGTQGPTWATMLNDALGLVDSHDHSTGKGTKVTPAGMTINQDLPFANNNLTGLRQSRYQDQGGNLSVAADNGGFYRNGDDIYWRDGAGNNVRITAGGNVNASGSGGITGMGGTTAAVTYSDLLDTFTFTHNTNLSAKIDVSEITIREYNVVSPNGITLKSPAALAGAYSITLLTALPATNRILSISNTGALSAGAAGAIVTADIADSQVTAVKVAAGFVVGYSRVTNLNLSTASTIPYDDTTPRWDEGAAITNGSIAYTAKKAGNKLRIRVVGQVAGATIGNNLIVSLFKDAALAADLAIAAMNHVVIRTVSSNPDSFDMEFEDTAADVAAHTYAVRLGSQDGSNVFFGVVASPTFGGVRAPTNFMEITEIQQ